jgi:hypothetical protein
VRAGAQTASKPASVNDNVIEVGTFRRFIAESP